MKYVFFAHINPDIDAVASLRVENKIPLFFLNFDPSTTGDRIFFRQGKNFFISRSLSYSFFAPIMVDRKSTVTEIVFA